MADIEVRYDGELALTTAQAAARYGLDPIAMRKALSRLDVEPLPEPLDSRTPLYRADQLDAAMANRPGRGANLRKAEPDPKPPAAPRRRTRK